MSVKAGSLKVAGFVFLVVGLVLLIIGFIAAEAYNYNRDPVPLWAWILMWVGIILVVIGALMAIAGAFTHASHKDKIFKEMYIEEHDVESTK